MKVFLGVGHGGRDSGAVGYIVEKDGALVIATACKDYLISNGVEVKMSRYIDEDESLTSKINECNAYNPDLCADIHLNAGRWRWSRSISFDCKRNWKSIS